MLGAMVLWRSNIHPARNQMKIFPQWYITDTKHSVRCTSTMRKHLQIKLSSGNGAACHSSFMKLEGDFWRVGIRLVAVASSEHTRKKKSKPTSACLKWRRILLASKVTDAPFHIRIRWWSCGNYLRTNVKMGHAQSRGRFFFAGPTYLTLISAY